MSFRPLPLISSEPGDRGWGEFVEWVRAFLYMDPYTGLVCFRPRDASHFTIREDPELAARVWNAGSANRPIQVQGRRGYGMFVRFDGKLARWSAVRKALGLIGKEDPNRDLPDPKVASDADLADAFGIGYVLMRHQMKRENQERRAAEYDAAVAKYEARIGRVLTAHEKKVARAAVLKL